MSIVWVSLEEFVWYQSLQVPLEKIALLYVILPLVWVAVADKATVPPVLAIFVVGFFFFWYFIIKSVSCS